MDVWDQDFPWSCYFGGFFGCLFHWGFLQLMAQVSFSKNGSQVGLEYKAWFSKYLHGCYKITTLLKTIWSIKKAYFNGLNNYEVLKINLR